jgi:predicted nucleic acid-binding protein
VDASVAIIWFVEEQSRADAMAVLNCIADIAVADLFFAGFANVLWKKARKGEVGMQQAVRAISSVGQFLSEVVKSAHIIESAFSLAQNIDHSVYDCLYLACAESRGSRFVTADKHFFQKLRGSVLAGLVMPLSQASLVLAGR